MSHARKYHAPGMGGRTGMTVGEDVRSVSGFYEAGKKAMDGSVEDRTYDDDEDDYDETREEEQSRSGRSSRYASRQSMAQSVNNSPASASASSPNRRGRKASAASARQSGVGSSSMDIENSSAPSPRTYGRRSQRGQDDQSSHLQDSSFNSLIDYGEGADDSLNMGRPSLGASSAGRGRGRASGASALDNSFADSSRGRIESSRPSVGFDTTRPLDDVDYDDGGGMPMDGGDEMPSFGGADGSMSIGSSSHRGDENEVAEALIEVDVGEGGLNGTAAGQEERVAAKRGRKPKKNGIQVDRVAELGKGPPPGEQRGNWIIERIPSSKGRAGSVVDGEVRRSTRTRIAPLQYWRGEHMVYGPPSAPQSDRDPDDTVDADAFEDAPVKSYKVPHLPVLREIVRAQRNPDEGTFSGIRLKTSKRRGGAAGRGRGRGGKRKRRRAGSDDDDDDDEPDPTQPTRHAEDGWDDDTDPHGRVWDQDRADEVERRISCPKNQVRTKQAANSPFAFEKVFGVDDYMAAGILEIPVGGSKPTKPTKDNNYTFVVLEGAVDVRVHRTLFRIAPGGMFMVPKGNTYSIENCCARQARIFFAQARQANSKNRQAADASMSRAATSLSQADTSESKVVLPSSSSAGQTRSSSPPAQPNGRAASGRGRGRGRPRGSGRGRGRGVAA